MMLIQVDSEGTAKPVQENLPVPVREGKLVHAGLNVYHTDRIFIAEPVIETIPETNTMKSSTTTAKPSATEGPKSQGDAKPAEATKAAAAPGGNEGGDNGGKKTDDPKVAGAGGNGGRDGGKNGGGKSHSDDSAAAPQSVKKETHKPAVGRLVVGCLAIVLIGIGLLWWKSGGKQDVKEAVGKIADKTKDTAVDPPAPVASGTVAVKQTAFSGPVKDGYQRILINDGTLTVTVETNDTNLGSQGLTDGKAIAMNHSNNVRSRVSEDMIRNMQATSITLTEQAKRLQEAEAKLALQQQLLERKTNKAPTVLVVHPVEPVYQSQYRPVFTTSYMPRR